MATSSILGGEHAPQRAKGRDIDTMGPSDSSDSGSDIQGERTMSTEADNPGELGALPVDTRSDSDAAGTGERGSATGQDVETGADILPDRVANDPSFSDAMAGDAGLSIDPDVPVEELAQDTDDEGDDEDEDGSTASE